VPASRVDNPRGQDPSLRGQGHVFGRRKGKALRAGQAKAVAELLPGLAIDLSRPAPARLGDLFPAGLDAIALEIGFGGGERMIADAAEHPRTGFLGAEPFLNGLAKAVVEIARRKLGNVRLHGDDAALLLDWLPATSLDRVDLFHPDPWPKKRHAKRRFVSAENLQRIARALKPRGQFRFASDIGDYVNWTLLQVGAHPAFVWEANRADDWRLPPAGWTQTRYEMKARAAGRVPAWLTFRRM
jgi:tRNA (guanine-N7-)-methyltransferase